MLSCLIVEDNARLRQALRSGLEETGQVKISAAVKAAKPPCLPAWRARHR